MNGNRSDEQRRGYAAETVNSREAPPSPKTHREATMKNKTYYCVVTTINNNGRVSAHIVDKKQAEEQPKSTHKSTRTADVYVDWYDTETAAKKAVEDAKKA